MRKKKHKFANVLFLFALIPSLLYGQADIKFPERPTAGAKRSTAKSAILFLGDGMSLATVAATRIFSVGVGGQLNMDRFPYTALARTASADHMTTDSAAAMSQIVTGKPTNNGVISMGASTEVLDFNNDGDGAPTTTILELAKAAGKSIGVVTNTRVTHATPAACYAHINSRCREAEIALQALPSDPTFNPALGNGIDLIAGGGRGLFIPKGVVDEEGQDGWRTDQRDLRAEFTEAGYTYVWNLSQWNSLSPTDLPILALFESSHMAYEWDRPYDRGREPSLVEMTIKAIELLSLNKNGFVLMVEGGRIDHAHHECNVWRVMTETETFDKAIGAAVSMVDLRRTLVLVTSDHGHVFNFGGYPLRPIAELPYPLPVEPPSDYLTAPFSGILNVVFGLDKRTGTISEALDLNKIPFTVLSYGNGPGFRSGPRVDPREDQSRGYLGATPNGPADPSYRFEAAVPLAADTHSGEDQGIWAIGAESRRVRGTVPNTQIFYWMRDVLGL